MGFGASEVRLLTLYSRTNAITGELQHCDLEKTALMHRAEQNAKEYQAALSTKVLKFSNDSGLNYVDITYSGLMRPNTMNKNQPCILANNAGKIVLDSKYKKLAEKFSPDGKAVGDWSNYRNEIISSLTGISVDQLNQSEESAEGVDAKWKEYEKLCTERDNIAKSEKSTLICKSDKVVSLLDGDLSKGGSYTIKNPSDLKTLMKSVYNSLSKYFIDENAHTMLKGENSRQKLDEICSTFAQTYAYVTTNTEQGNKMREGSDLFSGKAGDVKVDLRVLMEHIMGGLQEERDGLYLLRDTSKNEWIDWYNSLVTKEDECKAAYQEYVALKDSDNQIFTSAQEQQIAFYDQLFTAIAENGWVEDLSVGEPDYLNQMLQNNEYVFMTMTENADYVDNKDALDYETAGTRHKYDYSQDIALNHDNIFAVKDSDLNQQALVKYENEKYIINSKEAKVDQRMTNLKTEKTAIDTMIENIESIRDKNGETYFNIFA